MTMYGLQLTAYSFRAEFAWSLVIVLMCATIALFVNLQAGVFALLFAGIGWWVWQRPEDGLLLLIILLPILPMLKITQTIGTATLIKDVIIGVLFVRQCIVPLLTKQLPYRRNILFAPIGALAAWTLVELLQADSLILGVLRARDIGLYVLLYFAVLYLSHTPEHMRRRLAWFSVSFAIVLLLGAYQWFFAVDSAVLRFDPVREVWIPRLSSTLAHPSIFGQYLVAAASLFGAAALFLRSRLWQLACGVAFAVTLPFVYLTYSRAVWIGLAAAVVAMGLAYLLGLLLISARQKRVWQYGAGAVAALIIIFVLIARFTPAGVFLRSAFDPTYGSNVERLEFAARLLAPMTNIQAIVGRGLGDVLEQNFREINLEAYDIVTGASRAVQLTKNTTLVDNQYLKTFVEMGLVGLLIYIWIYWRVAKRAISLLTQRPSLRRTFTWSQRSPVPTIIGLWGIGFLAAFVIQAFFIDIWDIFPTNAVFWIAAGLISALQTPAVGDTP